ncbi:hypothetical protein BC828DRAFT_205466 [Blastocladiella britannica]|nr:hypothetical protein BC828DRAFT_205466 [Blastocladiella britannica]
MPLVPETHAMLRPILASHAARTRCPVSVVLWQGQVACYTPDWMHLTNLEQLVMVVVAARYLTRSSGFAQDICLHDTSPTVQHRLIGFNVGGLGLAVVSLTSARHAQLGVGDLAIPDVWQSIPHSIHGMDSALLADMPWLQGLHAHIPTHQASILVLRTDVRVAVKRWLTVVELERELNPSVDRVILASVTVLDNTIATVYWRRYAMIDLMLLLDASIPESSLERIAVQVATLVLAFVQ